MHQVYNPCAFLWVILIQTLLHGVQRIGRDSVLNLKKGRQAFHPITMAVQVLSVIFDAIVQEQFRDSAKGLI